MNLFTTLTSLARMFSTTIKKAGGGEWGRKESLVHSVLYISSNLTFHNWNIKSWKNRFVKMIQGTVYRTLKVNVIWNKRVHSKLRKLLEASRYKCAYFFQWKLERETLTLSFQLLWPYVTTKGKHTGNPLSYYLT